jgi:hypothetical protein
MDPKILTALKRELIWDCLVAIDAWSELKELARVGRKREPGAIDFGDPPNLELLVRWNLALWIRTQAILTSTATLSRILWPYKPKDLALTNRAIDLLEDIQPPPLAMLQNRDPRNALEHIESDGPEWFEWAMSAFPDRPLLGWGLGDGGPVGAKQSLPEECFRYLNTTTWEFTVAREKPYRLDLLIHEVETLRDRIDVDTHLHGDLP